MKNMFFPFLILALGVCACNEEELTPSLKDEDRVSALVDLSRPVVKEFKEKYDVNILYDFDDTLDFKFNMTPSGTTTQYDMIQIEHLEAGTEDYALAKLDEMVLSYLKEDFRKILPKKILLANEVLTSSTPPDLLVGESDCAESKSYTAMGNLYGSYLFAFNESVLEELDEQRQRESRNVKLYNFINYVINLRGLSEDIPDAFYSPVSHLHGISVDSIAEQELELPVGTGMNSQYYTPEWYIGLGMVLTEKSPNANTYGAVMERRIRKGGKYNFPDKERDFRNFINLIVCESEENLTKYYMASSLFKERLLIVMDMLETWGVDVLKINPALEMFKSE